MIRLFLLLIIISLAGALVWELRKYFKRDEKIDELHGVIIEGELVDIDMDIAKEKARQKRINSNITNIRSNTKTNKRGK